MFIKIITRDKMADLNAVFSLVFETFGIRRLNAYQREAIVQFVQKKTDVFVNLPTGYGKSLIYQALPFVYDSIFEAAGLAGQYCCCGFAACKSYERPSRQTGKSWNSCRFSQWDHWLKCKGCWGRKNFNRIWKSGSVEFRIKKCWRANATPAVRK